MFTGEQSIWIPRERSVVYGVATNYPNFVSFFKASSKKTSETSNFMTVEVHSNLLGILPTVWLGEGIKVENQKIEFTQTKGLFKGLKAIWSFYDEDKGTKVIIQTIFKKEKLGNVMEKILGKYVVEKTTRNILNELKRAASLK